MSIACKKRRKKKISLCSAQEELAIGNVLLERQSICEIVLERTEMLRNAYNNYVSVAGCETCDMQNGYHFLAIFQAVFEKEHRKISTRIHEKRKKARKGEKIVK